MTLRLLALLCAAGAAWSYVPRDPMGANLHRVDASNIQFLVNQNDHRGPCQCRWAGLDHRR